MRRLTQQFKPVRTPRRRIEARLGDTIVLGEFEIDTEILAMVLDSDVRGLWAFLQDKDGRVQPTLFIEERVIWLEPKDTELGID